MAGPQDKKEYFEKLVLDHFIHAYPEFPEGKIMKSESPDFILWRSYKKGIGIEVSRLHLPPGVEQHNNGNAAISITTLAENIFSGQKGRNIYLHVIFNDIVHRAGLRIPAAVKLLAMIEEALDDHGIEDEFIEIRRQRNKSSFVNSLFVYHKPGMDHSIWEAGANASRDEYFDAIMENIEGKEEKIELYKRMQVDKCWLLLVGTNLKSLITQSMENRIRELNSASSFEKILLFDFFESKIYDLK